MWLTLIVAETISSTSGIGYMTMNAREFLQTDVVVLGVLHLCAARQGGGSDGAGFGAPMPAFGTQLPSC